MTPAIAYAQYLELQSERKEKEKANKMNSELYSLQKELMEEQIKEARLRNELLQASLDKAKSKG